MGRELQKRKRRSSRPTIKQPNRPKHALNPTGNTIIAKNWNKKETLSQNYRRLGLVAKLGRPTGGVEPEFWGPATTGGDNDGKGGETEAPAVVGSGRRAARSRAHPFAVTPLAQQVVTEAKVERDAAGKIVRILGHGRDDNNPLNDPLRRFDSDSEDGDDQDEEEEWGGIRDATDEAGRPEVVRQLEHEAGRPVQKRVWHPSKGEVEWLERLVQRHGDDTAAMARDMKLNPMQQTRADISRRLRRWKANRGEA